MLLKLVQNIFVQAVLETRKIKPLFMNEMAVTKIVSLSFFYLIPQELKHLL